ncbi:MAG TPA: RNA methyltransferase, partial [Ilumatobacter sp.]|nr:RNA methyltransferase [Ilumatobacter sp.]
MHTGFVLTRIDDIDDARLADYRELRDQAARRRIEGDEFFIAEGPVAIERLLTSGHRVRSVLLSEQKHARMAGLFLDRDDVSVLVVDRALLHDIVGFDLHRGAIAAADRHPARSLADITATSGRIAVLEGLNDPENLGAIARSARALGIDALVLDPTCIDPYSRRTVRVSMGEILFLPWCRVDEAEWPAAAFDELHRAEFDTWAMTPAPDSVDVWGLPVSERVAVMFGAEGPGLSERALSACHQRVRIPIA